MTEKCLQKFVESCSLAQMATATAKANPKKKNNHFVCVEVRAKSWFPEKGCFSPSWKERPDPASPPPISAPLSRSGNDIFSFAWSRRLTEEVWRKPKAIDSSHLLCRRHRRTFCQAVWAIGDCREAGSRSISHSSSSPYFCWFQ